MPVLRARHQARPLLGERSHPVRGSPREFTERAFFEAHEFAAPGDLSRDRDVTLINAQFSRADQLDKYVEYQLTPSFYTLHTYYFAEAHLANRGEKQPTYISPMRDAIDRGLHPTGDK